jgi:arsenate reductase (thioredoxin)
MAERPTRRVLFVCVQNAGRSQMAAALFNRYATEGASAESAGTRPAARVHPEVVAAMREVGIDLEGNTPQRMTAELAAGVDRVVTMGCGDECPLVRAPVEDWALPDPAGQPLATVRAVRDEIDARVRSLLASLDEERIKRS